MAISKRSNLDACVNSVGIMRKITQDVSITPENYRFADRRLLNSIFRGGKETAHLGHVPASTTVIASTSQGEHALMLNCQAGRQQRWNDLAYTPPMKISISGDSGYEKYVILHDSNPVHKDERDAMAEAMCHHI